jgi:hypothetical protein
VPGTGSATYLTTALSLYRVSATIPSDGQITKA